MTAVVESRKLTTLVVGHRNSNSVVPVSVQVVRTVIRGVLKATCVLAGHEMVVGTVEPGNVTVVTVAPGAVIVVLMPVQ